MATEKSTVKLILKSFPNFFFQKYDLNILRFMQVSPLMLQIISISFTPLTQKKYNLLIYI